MPNSATVSVCTVACGGRTTECLFGALLMLVECVGMYVIILLTFGIALL